MTSRLTPHQRETLDTLTRLAARGRPVPEAAIGSRGALFHLAAKGRAHVADRQWGPRGGEYRFWLPGPRPVEKVEEVQA